MKKIALALNLDWPLYRYHEVFRGIQCYAKENTDWKVIWDHFPEYALRRSGDKPYYDGIIGRIKRNAWTEAKKLNIPVVNTWYSNDIKDFPSVLIDYKKTGKMAANHLLDRGVTNFVVIDHDNKATSRDFYSGVTKALKKKKFTAKRYHVRHDISESQRMWEQFCDDFSKWIKEWDFPLGIACSVSSLGPNITSRLKANNIDIPKDAIIIASTNDPAYCEVTRPMITSVNQDYFSVGFESARMMHQQLEGEKPAFRKINIAPLPLTARESTDFYRFKNAVLSEALRFIADNYTSNISYRDVVANVSVSRRNLDLLFKKFIGHTVMDEIYRLRIAALKRLLKESETSVSKLYKETGFNSPSHMRRVFSRYIGVPPSKFRERARVNE